MTTDSRGANVFAAGHVGDNCPAAASQSLFQAKGERLGNCEMVHSHEPFGLLMSGGWQPSPRAPLDWIDGSTPQCYRHGVQCAAIANRTKLFGMIVMFGFNQTASMWCAELIGSTLSGWTKEFSCAADCCVQGFFGPRRWRTGLFHFLATAARRGPCDEGQGSCGNIFGPTWRSMLSRGW